MPLTAVERTYNGAHLAGALAKKEGHEVKVFLIGKAAAAAHTRQKVAQWVLQPRGDGSAPP